MRSWANILKVALVASLLLLVPTSSTAEQRKLCTILIVGDSVSSGYGLLEHEGWVAQFRVVAQEMLPANIVNHSRSGLTIEQAIPLVEKASTLSPDITILQVGSNDALVRRPVGDIRVSLEKLLDRLEHTKVLVIEGTAPADYDSDYRQRLAEVYKNVTRNTSAILIDIPFEQYLHNPEYFQNDRIHPNARGHRVILKAVISTFNNKQIGKANSC